MLPDLILPVRPLRLPLPPLEGRLPAPWRWTRRRQGWHEMLGGPPEPPPPWHLAAGHRVTLCGLATQEDHWYRVDTAGVGLRKCTRCLEQWALDHPWEDPRDFARYQLLLALYQRLLDLRAAL